MAVWEYRVNVFVRGQTKVYNAATGPWLNIHEVAQQYSIDPGSALQQIANNMASQLEIQSESFVMLDENNKWRIFPVREIVELEIEQRGDQ